MIVRLLVAILDHQLAVRALANARPYGDRWNEDREAQLQACLARSSS